VALPDKLLQIRALEDFTSRVLLAHQTKGGVICAVEAVLPQYGATIRQGRTREIVEGERDHRHLQLDPTWPPAKPPGGAALQRTWQIGRHHVSYHSQDIEVIGRKPS